MNKLKVLTGTVPMSLRQTVGNVAKAKKMVGKRPNSIGWKKTVENESNKILSARKDEVATGMLNSSVGQLDSRVSNPMISNSIQQTWKDDKK